MPEGDTVWHTAAVLAEALRGKILVRSDIRVPALATLDLAGHNVVDVRPVGKHLFVRVAGVRGEVSLHSHLRMDGAWQVYRAGRRWRMPAHHARAILGVDGAEAVGFRVHDLQLVQTLHEGRVVGHLGPDLLDPQWSDEDAYRAARSLEAEPVRELGLALLDQRVMAGIGNLYKAEICYLLGTSPWSPVSDVDAGEVVRLARKLLLANISRPQRFVQSTTGELARGRTTWVYGRTRQGCLRCGGRVRVSPQGSDVQSRPTWFCPRCQSGPAPAP